MDVDKRVGAIHLMNLRLNDVYYEASFSDFPLLMSALAGDALEAKLNFVLNYMYCDVAASCKRRPDSSEWVMAVYMTRALCWQTSFHAPSSGNARPRRTVRVCPIIPPYNPQNSSSFILQLLMSAPHHLQLRCKSHF